MGFCLCFSVASSDQIHEDNGYGEDNKYGEDNAVLYFEESTALGGAVKGVGSVYSLPGSKDQDAAILHQGYGSEKGVLCGVFDGHGKDGRKLSNFVRNRLPVILLNQMNALQSMPSRWQEAFVSAFKAMDRWIKLQNFDNSLSGTTAVVVVRQGGDLLIANLGDSRAVLVKTDENGEPNAAQLTTDLKPSVPSEAERIRMCNGRVLALSNESHIQRVWLPHENSPGLAMSRAFGDFILKNYGITVIPDISHHRLSSNDQFLVLACDGVWDVLSNEEVASVVWKAESEEAAARAVAEAATTAWKRKFPSATIDDITVICLLLNSRSTYKN